MSALDRHDPLRSSSKVDGLSPHLQASLFEVGPDGIRLPGTPWVSAPFTDTNIELTANWQSPFEQAGAESKAPAITQGLQSGAFGALPDAVLGTAGNESLVGRGLNAVGRVFGSKNLSQSLRDAIGDATRDAQGRTGMTKLNSTQVFTGAAPVKIPLTLHFRAFEDPAKEVEQPVGLLASWVLAQHLELDGPLAAALRGARDGRALDALLPSTAPTMVGLRIDGKTFAPLVIEGLSYSMSGPREGRSGAKLNVAVVLQLSSLTALDRTDWARARAGEPVRLFSQQQTDW